MNCTHCNTPTSNPKFCSSSCSAKHNNRGVRRHGIAPFSKLCLNCGQPTNRTSSIYCSNKCQGQHKRRKNFALVEADEQVSWRQIRRYLLETVGTCQQCGISEWQGTSLSLECDHVNGDKSNNRLSNARLLCPNCHSITPTYRVRNKGNPNGQEIRDKRYRK